MQCDIRYDNAIVLRKDNYWFQLMDIKLISILLICLGILYFLGKQFQEAVNNILNHLNWIILQNNEILEKLNKNDEVVQKQSFSFNEPSYLPTEITNEEMPYLSTEMNGLEEMRNEIVRDDIVAECIKLSNTALDENCNAKSTATNYKRIVNNIIENADNNTLEMIKLFYTENNDNYDDINNWITEESKKGKVKAALLKAFTNTT